MRDVVIVSAARTAIGKAPKGTLRHTRPDDLAAVAIRAAVERAPGLDPDDIDDVILGCAMPEGEQGMNVARVAALRAGLPKTTPGATINRFCASGLEAIATAAAKIAAGHADVIVAGGTESMSLVEFLGPNTKPNPWLVEHEPDTYLSMGLSVEGLSQTFRITREMADELAAQSHAKALAAQDAGKFDDEVVPVPVKVQRTGGAGREIETVLFARDEGPRRDTSPDSLAKLRPAFRPDGILTAGNASQRSDGAAAVILTTRARAAELGLAPIARFAGYAVAAVAPQDFGIAPAHAIPKLLKQAGIKIDDVDLIEFNEAFAAQTLASNKVFALPPDRVNVNGGAVALGHPLGATGARQTVTLLHEGRRRMVRYGMVTMCAALGMGAAGLFEMA